MKLLVKIILIFSPLLAFSQEKWEFSFTVGGGLISPQPTIRDFKQDIFYAPYGFVDSEYLLLDEWGLSLENYSSALTLQASYAFSPKFAIAVNLANFGLVQLFKDPGTSGDYSNEPIYLRTSVTWDIYYRNTTLHPMLKYNLLNERKEQLNLTLGAPLSLVNVKYFNDVDVSFEPEVFVNHYEELIRKGTSVGWSFGFEWIEYFSEKWGYVISAQMMNTTFVSNKMSRTVYTVDGVDALNTLTHRDNNFVFEGTDNPDNLNAPTVLNYGTWKTFQVFLTLGVTYAL